MEMSRSSDWNSENYFNYILDTKGHHINAMVGQSFNQSVDGFELKGSAKDFPADNYRDIASTLNSTTKNVEGALKVKTTSLSYFGRLIYLIKISIYLLVQSVVTVLQLSDVQIVGELFLQLR